ncbi:MAG: hypothetical protein WD896_00125 [Parcubacteria group bacterium]
MKNLLIIIVIIAALAGGVYWSKSLQSNDPNILSTRGIHWHPILTIYVKGEKQIIPPNIGIGTQYASTPTYDSGMRMTAIHTHDDANEGVIHFEFSGVVRKEDTTLGQFFKIWGKDINSLGSNVKMTVNGQENTELGEYPMKDGDKIELRYE